LHCNANILNISSNLLQLEKDGSIIDRDLEIYTKHRKNLGEDFKGTL